MSSPRLMGPPTGPIRRRPHPSTPHGPSYTETQPDTGAAASSAHAPPIPADPSSGGEAYIPKPAGGVDMSAQTRPSLYLAAFRYIRGRLRASFDEICAPYRAKPQGAPTPVIATPTIQARLENAIGHSIYRRPLRMHGWESLIVPLLSITFGIPLFLACIYPLWAASYARHIASRVRLLQRQHTLAVTPSLVASLRSLTLPRVTPHTHVHAALYRLCAAEAPNGPACDAGVHQLLESPLAFDVLDSPRHVGWVVGAHTARVEAEYTRAKRMEVELGVRNASSKPFHAVVGGLDEAIVRAVRAVHESVGDAVSAMDEFKRQVGKEGMVSKWNADRERLAWQARQGMDAAEVIGALDEAIEALAAWKGELDETAAKWAQVYEWIKGEDEKGAMWWVPRHLWDQVHRLEGHPGEGAKAEAGHQGEL